MNRPIDDTTASTPVESLSPGMKRAHGRMAGSNDALNDDDDDPLDDLKPPGASTSAGDEEINATDALKTHLLGKSSQKSISIDDSDGLGEESEEEEVDEVSVSVSVSDRLGPRGDDEKNGGNDGGHDAEEEDISDQDEPDQAERYSKKRRTRLSVGFPLVAGHPSLAAGDMLPTPASIGDSTLRPTAGRKLTFPEKLMELLNDPTCQNAMSWLPNGNAFALHPNIFMKQILPKYFESTKFESFTRKLNRWGFKRIAGDDAPDDTFAYSHQLFRRDYPELCRGMSGGKKPQQDFWPIIRRREHDFIQRVLGMNYPDPIPQHPNQAQLPQQPQQAGFGPRQIPQLPPYLAQNAISAAAAGGGAGAQNNSVFSIGMPASGGVGATSSNDFLMAEWLWRQHQQEQQQRQQQPQQQQQQQLEQPLSLSGQLPQQYSQSSAAGGGAVAGPAAAAARQSDADMALYTHERIARQERIMRDMMEAAAIAQGNPFPTSTQLRHQPSVQGIPQQQAQPDQLETLMMLQRQQQPPPQQQPANRQQQSEDQQHWLRMQQQLAYQQQLQQQQNQQRRGPPNNNMGPPFM